MKKKKLFLIFTIFLVVGLFGALWVKDFLHQMSSQEVIFMNKSNYDIDLVEIDYAGTKLNLNQIKPNEKLSQYIKVSVDGSFDIKIIFSDGFEIKENHLGYITNGDGSNTSFLVTKDRKLEFDQKY